jgi:hypothetical protein
MKTQSYTILYKQHQDQAKQTAEISFNMDLVHVLRVDNSAL